MADVLLLDLGGDKMVLGCQWLSTLGDIVWNFHRLTMTFNYNNALIWFYGRKKECLSIIEKEKCEKLMMKCNPDAIQLCAVKIYANTQGSDIDKLVTIGELRCMEVQLPVVNASLDVTTLLADYDDVFAEPKEMPLQRSHDHKIVLKEDLKPMNIRPYRHSLLKKDVVEAMFKKLLQQGVIRFRHSEFASPVILVKKKDGTWRMCIDYRQLNDATIKNRFPIPLIDDLFDELHGSTIYSKLDLCSGYHQIRMCEEDVHKTAFRTHEGHYEYLVMPFGLTNAPSTFQGLMNEVFHPYLRKFVLVFFDDILIYSKSTPDHVSHIEQVLLTLRNHYLFAKKSKCSFVCTKVEYLGHFV